MSDKQLAKITHVHCGIGGYQDVMLGISFTLAGIGWGVGTPFIGSWCPGIVDPTQGAKWSEADRDAQFAKAMRYIGETLSLAKKRDVRELVGVPVEVEFEGGAIKSWRVLTEVL